MSRREAWAAAAAALVLGGCMRIYPDPELPDVVVEWAADFECSDQPDRVAVSLSSIEPEAEAGSAVVPCRDGAVRFPDVARRRYRLAARLEDAAGGVLGGHVEELDLRDGLSKRVSPFFGGARERNFRVAWTFAAGASCAALAAPVVVLQATIPDAGPLTSWAVPCEAGSLVSSIPIPGTFTLTARAIGNRGDVVATSPGSPALEVGPGTITDFGTLTLSPCAGACPE